LFNTIPALRKIVSKEDDMPIGILKDYLNENNIEYITISHSPAFTAQTIAASAGIRGKDMAKTVIVLIDGKLSMAVLPASYRVDLEMLANTLGAKKVELAGEQDFKNVFPDCEVGAMPPFGNLYGVDVYVAQSLAENIVIVFNACSHHELIRMSYRDFENLVQPKIIKFSVKQA
jgi:Ala-tRNA(Pro) deacylase